MTVIPMVTRQLLRTKQAAAYLSMSEWKLRRLIQTEIIPFVQDQRGGPFLVDVRDLDAYIEGNKHNISDAHHWEYGEGLKLSSTILNRTSHLLEHSLAR